MIGNIIKHMRKTSGYSQKRLAELVGVAPTTISGYELNTSQPNYETVAKIAAACDFDIKFIDKNNGEELI